MVRTGVYLLPLSGYEHLEISFEHCEQNGLRVEMLELIGSGSEAGRTVCGHTAAEINTA